MDAHNLLAEYRHLKGLHGLHFDAHGCARLVFGGETAVNLELDAPSGCIQLYSVIAPLPPGSREALYQTLLEANAFGAQTGGATLAVDTVQQEVLLCLRVDPEGSAAPAFADRLENFAAVARHWADEVA